MRSGFRLSHVWVIVAAVVVVSALALPATSRAGVSAVPLTASPTAPEVGVMGAASRDVARLVPAANQATVCASGTPLPGIDVSYYQGSAFGGSINWTQVAQSGLKFAYARAADGTGFLDPDFQTNYLGIKAVGMKAGAYLFYEPNQDPTAQANVLVAALREAGFASGDLEPVFDVEVTDGQSAATIAADLQTSKSVVQQALGTTPAIYTSWGFWNYSVNSTAFSLDPLWVANWYVSCPGLPVGWSTWSVWQYNDTTTVPGITVNVVDADESNGSALPLYTGSCATGILSTSPAVTPSAKIRAFLPLVVNNACG